MLESKFRKLKNFIWYDHAGNRDRVNHEVEAQIFVIMNSLKKNKDKVCEDIIHHPFLKDKSLNFFTTSFMQEIINRSEYDLSEIIYRKHLLEIERNGASRYSKIVKKCINEFAVDDNHSREILEYADRCQLNFEENKAKADKLKLSKIQQSQLKAEQIKKDNKEQPKHFDSIESIYDIIKHYTKESEGQKRQGKKVTKFKHTKKALEIFERKLEGKAKFMLQDALKKRNKRYPTKEEFQYIAAEIFAQNIGFQKGDFSKKEN